jgi:hypothetical protein
MFKAIADISAWIFEIARADTSDPPSFQGAKRQT